MSEGTSIRFITIVVPTQQAEISLHTVENITIGKDCSAVCLMAV
jgi:hypothetical protein